ncbi:MAG: DUF4337 domain-containing protein [Terracidiphilus sp.]
MDASEAHELREHAEDAGHEAALRPVAFTMSVLAVLVAVTTVLGHRAHTEAVLDQNKATDQWNLYQAKKIRSYTTSLAADLLSVTKTADKSAAEKIADAYASHQAKWAGELKDEQKKAHGLEAQVEKAEARAGRFDLAEALLEIGLVVTSVTLLTRKQAYWFLGMAFSAAGIAAAVMALLR